ECMISCPTDALTFRQTVRVAEEPSADETVSAEELKRVPLFSGLPYKFLQWNSGAIKRRILKPGELLCKEGEPGSTAFVLRRGKFEVSIRSTVASVENKRSGGWLRFFGRASTTADRATTTDANRK